jgi:UDP-N-acetylmuramate dehydrogenase
MIFSGHPMCAYTTLGLGGIMPLAHVTSLDDFCQVAGDCTKASVVPSTIGHGSNVVAADEGSPRPIIKMEIAGFSAEAAGDDTVRITARAGQSLGDLIEFSLAEGLTGLECLAGVPGTVGAMPIQNVSAYGQDTAAVLDRLTAWDWDARATRTMSRESCRLGYRTSVFKRSPRWTILEVVFVLRRSRLSAPIRYAEVTQELGVAAGCGKQSLKSYFESRAPIRDVARAVTAIRRRRGMVIELSNPNTRSVGSIFKRVGVDAGTARSLADRGAKIHDLPDGDRCVASSWLMGNAGFHLGQPIAPGVKVSSQYFTLVTDAGATAQAFLDAMLLVRNRIKETFGLLAEPEPDFLGARDNYPQLLALDW